MILKVEYLVEFESKFETVLDDESGSQLGTFGEITLDNKISRYCPFKITQNVKSVLLVYT
jgi:hypothetical protein